MIRKLVAFLFLMLDHIGLFYADLLPPAITYLLRVFGVLALVIFAHALAFGFLNTRHHMNYLVRLIALAVCMQFIQILLLPLSGAKATDYPLNIVFILVFAFIFLYGVELLCQIFPDRIGSLRLLEANTRTQSDRYDIRLPSTWSKTSRVVPQPNAPTALILFIGLLFIGTPLLFSLALPFDYGLFSLLSVLIFYIAEKSALRRKLLFSLIAFLVLIVLYTGFVFFFSRTIPFQIAALAVIPFCFSSVSETRPRRRYQLSFYFLYPVGMISLLLIRIILFA